MYRLFHQTDSARRPGAFNRFALGAALVALLLGTSAGANGSVSNDLPDLGDASSALISPELERRIGRDFLKQIHANLKTINDPILKYYVERHISDLAQYSELRDRVLNTVVIDSDQVNAFAVPGGVVGINLGLFLHAQDIHEYSSVVAHELAHVSQRHFARGVEEQRAQTLPTLASLIAALMIGAVGGGDAGIAALSAAQAVSQSKQLRYSRGREQEADRVGLNTLVRADLDPAGMARMFERMQRAYRFTRRPPEFLLTHPLSETRIADARTQAQKFANRPHRESLDYDLMRARAQVHYAESPQAAVKMFEKMVADEPQNLAAEYGLAVALGKAQKFGEALALTEALMGRKPNSILYLGSHADMLTQAGKHAEAAAMLSHQLVLNPDNAALAMLYANALNAGNQHAASEAVLERQSQLRGNDVDVWYNLAETAGLAGNIVGVHQARAEYFAMHGAYERAVQHLQYARRLVEDNRQTLARIDARITELRTYMRERSS